MSPRSATASLPSSPFTTPSSTASGALAGRRPGDQAPPRLGKPISLPALPGIAFLARRRRRRRLRRRAPGQRRRRAFHADAQGAVPVVPALRGRRRPPTRCRHVHRRLQQRVAHRAARTPDTTRGVPRCNGRAGGVIVMETVQRTGTATPGHRRTTRQGQGHGRNRPQGPHVGLLGAQRQRDPLSRELESGVALGHGRARAQVRQGSHLEEWRSRQSD